MNIEEIRELAALLEGSDLNVLEVSEGESRIRLEKAAPVQVMPAAAPVQVMPAGALPVMSAGTLPIMPAGAGSDLAQSAGAEAASENHTGKAVKCPMVGVFYSAPAPGEKPFVSVGSKVEKGDVLCIVEAMKLMNEISAETDGEITEVCVEDGAVVEFGQPLFYIR